MRRWGPQQLPALVPVTLFALTLCGCSFSSKETQEWLEETDSEDSDAGEGSEGGEEDEEDEDSSEEDQGEYSHVTAA